MGFCLSFLFTWSHLSYGNENKEKLKKYSYFTNYSYACEPVDKNEIFPFLQERYTLAEIEFHFHCCPYEQL